jgi:D-hydroxyproline dehydrogenase subunit gamma
MCMLNQVTLRVNDRAVSVPHGSSVAVAVAISGQWCRKSVTGEPRTTLCAMGICYECRVVINGKHHCKSCQILCEPDMEVKTNE